VQTEPPLHPVENAWCPLPETSVRNRTQVHTIHYTTYKHDDACHSTLPTHILGCFSCDGVHIVLCAYDLIHDVCITVAGALALIGAQLSVLTGMHQNSADRSKSRSKSRVPHQPLLSSLQPSLPYISHSNSPRTLKTPPCDSYISSPPAYHPPPQFSAPYGGITQHPQYRYQHMYDSPGPVPHREFNGNTMPLFTVPSYNTSRIGSRQPHSQPVVQTLQQHFQR
jgi:hypothetical protein